MDGKQLPNASTDCAALATMFKFFDEILIRKSIIPQTFYVSRMTRTRQHPKTCNIVSSVKVEGSIEKPSPIATFLCSCEGNSPLGISRGNAAFYQVRLQLINFLLYFCGRIKEDNAGKSLRCSDLSTFSIESSCNCFSDAEDLVLSFLWRH